MVGFARSARGAGGCAGAIKPGQIAQTDLWYARQNPMWVWHGRRDLLSCHAGEGEHRVTFSSERRLSRVALAAALTAALGLAACGRKGPLEMPPGAAIDQPVNTPETPGQAVQGVMVEGGGPTPPRTRAQAPRKSIFLDWLID